VSKPRILVTNDDGWDAPGLQALKRLAAELGEVYVLAPRDQHSYAGHRVTTHDALDLQETAPNEFHLSGTPADCVRVGIASLFPHVDWVLAGINRGGNLGADLFTSGTVAAAREATLLGRRGIAISQYMRSGIPVDWDWSRQVALPVVAELMSREAVEGEYWNVNLPHVETGAQAPVIHVEPDRKPLDVKFRRDGGQFHYAGSYQARPRTPGMDIDLCFNGAVTVSRLVL
jgi:5'-nucleotidase